MSSKQKIDFILYSDGGGERAVSGASACVVEEQEHRRRIHLAAFLGGATNNEAEITAGLLGLSFLNLYVPQGGVIQWVCDSEYALKSATEYIHNWQRNGWRTSTKEAVKNQELWQAFLALSARFRIIAKHVRGHSGHRENELCDTISTWVRENGAERLTRSSFVEVQKESPEGSKWFLVDGRPFLKKLRDGECSEEDSQHLTQLLAIHGLTDFGGDVAGDSSEKRTFELVRKKLTEAKQLAEHHAGESAAVKSLVEKLAEVLRSLSY